MSDVLRSIGLISRADNPWRAVNAGPELPIPAAQLHGPHLFSFAWCPDPLHAVEHAERFRLPILAVAGRGEEMSPSEHAGPELTGAVLSSLRRREGALEVRIFNESESASRGRFGEVDFELRPWEIRTIRLTSRAGTNG